MSRGHATRGPADQTRPTPLAAAHARRGVRLFALALGVLALVEVLLLAQAPAHLRGGTIVLALFLAAIFVGMAPVSLVWVWLVAWPRLRRRLSAARQVPARRRDVAGGSIGVAPVVAGGLVVAAVMWTTLSLIGVVGAPLLWVVVAVVDLETARLTHRRERREGVTYAYEYAAPGRGERAVVALLVGDKA